MTVSHKFIALLLFTFVWFQTATLWHDVEHSLEGHDHAEFICKILSGTAEQPAACTADAAVTITPNTEIGFPVFDDVVVTTIAVANRSRAPPLG